VRVLLLILLCAVSASAQSNDAVNTVAQLPVSRFDAVIQNTLWEDARPDLRESTLPASPTHPVCAVLDLRTRLWHFWKCGEALPLEAGYFKHHTVWWYSGPPKSCDEETHVCTPGTPQPIVHVRDRWYWLGLIEDVGLTVADEETTQAHIHETCANYPCTVAREGNPFFREGRAAFYSINLTMIAAMAWRSYAEKRNHDARQQCWGAEPCARIPEETVNRILPWWAMEQSFAAVHIYGIFSAVRK